MKKVVGILLVILVSAFLPTSNANVKPSIAILDTAVDINAAQLKDRIVYEVCVMETSRCPNGMSMMEGPGSASLPSSQLYKNGFEHGTIMASVAAQVNTNMNIVFIRVVPMASNGKTGIYTDRTVNEALKWVVVNKNKFNIVAVSASFGRHNFKSQTNYCPVEPALRDSIIALQNIGVASVFAAGNDYDYSRIDFPACISEAVSVGATEKTNRIALYSNGGNDLDFYALGDYSTPVKRAVGTSPAAAAFSAYWAKSYKGNYQLTYDYIKSLTKSVENTKVKSTLFTNVLG